MVVWLSDAGTYPHWMQGGPYRQLQRSDPPFTVAVMPEHTNRAQLKALQNTASDAHLPGIFASEDGDQISVRTQATYYDYNGKRYYRIGTDIGLSDTIIEPSKTVVAFVSDFGRNLTNPPYEAEVAKMVRLWNPQAIVSGGDNVNEQAGIGNDYEVLVEPFYGDFNTAGNFWPSIGNHDWSECGDSLDQYFAYFVNPPLNDQGHRRYYDVRIGNIHFFVVNSVRAPYEDPDGRAYNSVQGQWMEAKIKASDAPWKVVVGHYPPYSSNIDPGHESVTMRWPYREWGVDLVLSGHSHQYERLIVDGMDYIVAGLGGSPLSAFRASPWIAGDESKVRMNTLGHNGALRLTATEDELVIEAFDIQGNRYDTLRKERGWFAGIGDWGTRNVNQTNVANMVKNWQPEYVVTAGDNIYYSPGAYDTATVINTYWSYQYFLSNSNLYVAYGNHDLDPVPNLTTQTTWLSQYTYTDAGQPVSYEVDKTYYDFVRGQIHWFMVSGGYNNSNVVVEPDGIDVDSVQAQWLRRRLSESTARFKVVVVHHPPYSSCYHATQVTVDETLFPDTRMEYPRLRWPFKDWGADAVLFGHAHNYERLVGPDGLNYICIGASGQTLAPFSVNVSPYSVVRYSSNYGSLKGRVTEEGLYLEWWSISSDTAVDTVLVPDRDRADRPASNYGTMTDPMGVSLAPALAQVTGNEFSGGNTTEQRVTLTLAYTNGTDPKEIVFQIAPPGTDDWVGLVYNPGVLQYIDLGGTLVGYYWPNAGRDDQVEILGYNPVNSMVHYVSVRGIIQFVGVPPAGSSAYTVYSNRSEVWFQDVDFTPQPPSWYGVSPTTTLLTADNHTGGVTSEQRTVLTAEYAPDATAPVQVAFQVAAFGTLPAWQNLQYSSGGTYQGTVVGSNSILYQWPYNGNPLQVEIVGNNPAPVYAHWTSARAVFSYPGYYTLNGTQAEVWFRDTV
jgi:hypothetical protein